MSGVGCRVSERCRVLGAASAGWGVGSERCRVDDRSWRGFVVIPKKKESHWVLRAVVMVVGRGDGGGRGDSQWVMMIGCGGGGAQWWR